MRDGILICGTHACYNQGMQTLQLIDLSDAQIAVMVEALHDIARNIQHNTYDRATANELRMRLHRVEQYIATAAAHNEQVLRAVGEVKRADECREGGATLRAYIQRLLLAIREQGEPCN